MIKLNLVFVTHNVFKRFNLLLLFTLLEVISINLWFPSPSLMYPLTKAVTTTPTDLSSFTNVMAVFGQPSPSLKSSLKFVNQCCVDVAFSKVKGLSVNISVCSWKFSDSIVGVSPDISRTHLSAACTKSHWAYVISSWSAASFPSVSASFALMSASSASIVSHPHCALELLLSFLELFVESGFNLRASWDKDNASRCLSIRDVDSWKTRGLSWLIKTDVGLFLIDAAAAAAAADAGRRSVAKLRRMITILCLMSEE